MSHERFRERLHWLRLPIFLIGVFLSTAATAVTCPDVKNGKAFFDAVRSKIHSGSLSQEQVESYKCIFSYWHDQELDDKRWLAYAMATGWHEARMKPVREGFGSHERAVAAARSAYTKGISKRPYHLPDPTTGKIYYGRGLVQLTFAENYERLGNEIGVGDELLNNPDRVLDPDIATKVMFQGMLKGLFCSETKTSIMRKCGSPVKKYVPSRLGLYFNNQCEEWNRARRMINGDIAKTGSSIARYAKTYLTRLDTVPTPLVDQTPGPDDVPVVDPNAPEPTPPEDPEVTPQLPGEPVDLGEVAGSVEPTPQGQDVPQSLDEAAGETEVASNDNNNAPPVTGGGENATGGQPATGDQTELPGGTTVPAIDAAALDRLEAASAAQQADLNALKDDVATQKADLKTNNTTLLDVQQKLEQISAQLSELAQQVAELKGTAGTSSPATPAENASDSSNTTTTPADTGTDGSVETQPEGAKGWLNKAWGYVWKKTR